MRIDSSGRILFGATSGNSASARAIFRGFAGDGGAGQGLIHLEVNKTTTNCGAGEGLGSIRFGSNEGHIGAQISASAESAWSGSGDLPSFIRFNTCSDGSGTMAERMRITSSGRVLIGTTTGGGSEKFSVSATANSVVPMVINDSTNTATLTHRLMFQTGGTEVGRIRCTNSATQYDTSASDRTLKKNFEIWNEDVLSLFKNINPQKFNFIQEEDGANKTKGFIAQEITDSFPEAYSKGKDDKYWFNPSGMVVYLMKAIQELEAKVAALEAA